MASKKCTKHHLRGFSAKYLTDEIEVEADWRYQLIVPYIRQSNSYLAVREKYRGEELKDADLPKDEAAVYKVAEWFDILSIEADDDDGDQFGWWDRAGKFLYGFDKPIPSVSGTYLNENQTKTVDISARLVPSILIEVPLNLTMTEAQRGIKDLFQHFIKHWSSPIKFGMSLPDSYKAHYKLAQSKLREDTLIKGLEALTMYKAGLPLWRIGNALDLSPLDWINEDAELDQEDESDKKRVLSIKARQLVKIASLVAENAARGRFPSDKPFPEAILDSYKRPAGRPLGSKRSKRMKAG